jgi:hypothetical protein
MLALRFPKEVLPAFKGKKQVKQDAHGVDEFICQQHSAWIQVGVWQRNW